MPYRSRSSSYIDTRLGYRSGDEASIQTFSIPVQPFCRSSLENQDEEPSPIALHSTPDLSLIDKNRRVYCCFPGWEAMMAGVSLQLNPCMQRSLRLGCSNCPPLASQGARIRRVREVLTMTARAVAWRRYTFPPFSLSTTRPQAWGVDATPPPLLCRRFLHRLWRLVGRDRENRPPCLPFSTSNARARPPAPRTLLSRLQYVVLHGFISLWNILIGPICANSYVYPVPASGKAPQTTQSTLLRESQPEQLKHQAHSVIPRRHGVIQLLAMEQQGG